MRWEDHTLGELAHPRQMRPLLREVRVPVRVAAVGGGTGPPAVLGGLARVRRGTVPPQVSAVVTTCSGWVR